MKKHYIAFAAFFGLAALNTAQAQSITGGFMSGRNHGSVALTATTESYTNVFLIPEKVDGVPIFKRIVINSVSLYGTYGITPKIDVVLSVPYIRSAGQAGESLPSGPNYINVRGNFQDIAGAVKFKAFSREIGSTILDLLGTVGMSTPLSDYKTEQGLEYIVAIGNHSTKLNTSGIAHLKTASGVFFTGQAGYSWRDNRVPNAFVTEAKAGYAGRSIYIDAYVATQTSAATGTDILQPGFDGFFPATRVNYTRVGISGYRPVAKGLGISLAVSTYVAGRNLGQSTAYSVGGAYSF